MELLLTIIIWAKIQTALHELSTCTFLTSFLRTLLISKVIFSLKLDKRLIDFRPEY
jgi:hypothetical protein